MVNKNELTSYAIDFVSYILSKVEGVNAVILHGSVAEGDFNEESDIDLFFDIIDKRTEKKIKEHLDNYYKTKKFHEWMLKGIENPISIISGDLNSKEWKDLKRAMINKGIILYGKYKSEVEKINQYILFSFENIKPEKKRVSVFRKLFGFNLKKTRYRGLVEKAKGVKISKGSVIIPVEGAKEIKTYLQDKKVSFKIYDLWSDVKIEI